MSNALSVEDIQVLERTRRDRLKVLDNMMADGNIPAGREVYSFTALADSIDNNIFQQAKIRVEEASNKINEESKGLLTDLIKQLHKGVIPEGMGLEEAASSAPEFQPTGMEINEGELIRKTDDVGVEVLENL